MTYEEAIKEISKMKEFAEKRGSYYGDNAIPTYTLAISALEKQMPKNPKNIVDAEYDVSYKCPICGAKHVNEWHGTNWKLPFCSNCGQAIDWSDTE